MCGKSKIAVIIDSYTKGGVALALQVFLQVLVKENYEITLFVRNFDRSKMLPVPDGVVCLPWGEKRTFSPYHSFCSLLNWRNFGKKAVYQTRCRQGLPGEFDCAIAYQMISNDVTVMTLEKIRAKKKILWLHGRKNFRDADLPFYDALYSKADKIVCVSKETETRFQGLMPNCAGKTVTIHNFYDIAHMKAQAEACTEEISAQDDFLTIVSVGRLSKEKGFDRVAPVARKLLDDGCRFHWYIVGDGDKRSDIESAIQKENVAGHVHLLGYRQNPYPFVQQCDIYVQPSYTEGFCTSTMEAKILSKPVVTTDVPGMREQFSDGVNGLIVDSSVDGLYAGIKRLLDSPQLRQEIITRLQAEPISNDTALRQTLDVITGP